MVQLTNNTLFLTAIAMLAFAANSILCRLALLNAAIDAGSFTFLRLVSGALVLFMLLKITAADSQTNKPGNLKIKLASALLLFSYALSFSFAYISIATGTGALILFTSVQITMIVVHIWTGSRIAKMEYLGMAVSLCGFVYLLLPDATRPDLYATLLMIISGISWASFSLLGKRTNSAIASVSKSFFGASILAIGLSPWLLDWQQITGEGAALAILSGAIASGGGYALWYMVLPRISVLKASIVQLSVPALALIGGAVLLNEALSYSLVLATLLILGGIALVFLAKK